MPNRIMQKKLLHYQMRVYSLLIILDYIKIWNRKCGEYMIPDCEFQNFGNFLQKKNNSTLNYLIIIQMISYGEHRKMANII